MLAATQKLSTGMQWMETSSNERESVEKLISLKPKHSNDISPKNSFLPKKASIIKEISNSVIQKKTPSHKKDKPKTLKEW